MTTAKAGSLVSKGFQSKIERKKWTLQCPEYNIRDTFCISMGAKKALIAGEYSVVRPVWGQNISPSCQIAYR